MRVPAALFLVSILMPATAAVAASPQDRSPLGARPAPDCPRTSSYLADKTGRFQGEPLTPRKLNELPPATTYMAVYRHIGHCEAPLTMVEYRSPKRR